MILDQPVMTVPTRQGERTLVVDLYLPEVAGPRPLAMYVHGGGWRQGIQYRPPFRPRLFDEGIAVASITYRLSPEAPFPACLHDCRAMLRWLRAHAESYNIDPQRIALWGISAGGHLVSLMAMTAEEEPSEIEQPWADHPATTVGVVDWCGPTDLVRTFTDPEPGRDAYAITSQLLDGDLETQPDRVRAASPALRAHDNAPPHLIVHGRQDDVVPLWHAEALHHRLVELGVPSELVVNDNADHSLGQDLEVAATHRFLRRVLGMGGG